MGAQYRAAPSVAKLAKMGIPLRAPLAKEEILEEPHRTNTQYSDKSVTFRHQSRSLKCAPMAAKRINGLFYILLLTTLQLLSGVLNAQDQSSADTIAVKQPEAVSQLDLSFETERIREDVILARGRMASDERIHEIDSVFLLFSEMIEKEKEEYEVFRKVTPNRQKLDNMIFKWSGYSDRLSGWQRTLNRFQSRNSIGLKALDFDLKSWNLTATTLEQEDIPASVSESINKSIDELTSVISDIKGQNNRVITVETQIVEQKDDIAQLINDLEIWIQSGELKMLYRRHEPIWQTTFLRTEEEKARSGENSFMEKVRVLPEYFTTYEHDLNVYALWMLVIVALVLYLRKRLKDLDVSDKNRRVQRMKEIITKNTLATVCFLILLAVIIFLANLPQTLSELFSIGLLTSALILFRPFAYREFRWLIVLVIVAFVLEQLKSYFWFTSANYRLFMFVQTFFALAVIGYYTMQRTKVEKLVMGPIGKTLYKTIPLLIVIYIIAIIANILGYTNLSDLMLKIGTMAAVITVFTYGILIVFGGILAASIILYFESKADYNIEYRNFLQKRGQFAVGVFAIGFWIIFFLLSADLYRPLIKSLELWLSEPWRFGEMAITPGNILSFFGVLIITFIITRFIATVVQGGVMRPLKLSRGVPSAISLVIRYFIIVFGLVLSMGALGIDLSGFSLMAGALGVGIGFGLQNIISNFVSGIILIFERPILPGDTVEVGSVMGIVERIGVRSSVVRSFDGADVVVPNNTLLNNELINWTQSDVKKRIEIKIGVAYGTDPNKVLEILKDIALGYKYAQTEPAPMPLFDEFGDSALNFRLLFWVPVEFVLSAKSDVSIEIYNRFEEAGIIIPFPQRDINIIKQAPDSESTIDD
ncbi:MAG: hypothetical protein DRI69_04275 [Bacteroidetes bacterium]|nr:MAG: hypothetical protein DRI69_04275 [Bacteroidota bacterium]